MEKIAFWNTILLKVAVVENHNNSTKLKVGCILTLKTTSCLICLRQVCEDPGS